MRTQIDKKGYLPSEYIPPTFSTRTPPPPFAQVDGGGCSPPIFFLKFFSTRFNLPQNFEIVHEIFFYFFSSPSIPVSSYRALVLLENSFRIGLAISVLNWHVFSVLVLTIFVYASSSVWLLFG